MNNQVTKVKIKSLKIFKPTISKNSFNIIEEDNNNFDITNYQFFPILLNPDKSLWELANRYLLNKLKSYELPNPRTLDTIACDLKDFMNFCNEEEIDYLHIPRKLSNPIIKYKKNLLFKLHNNELSTNTIKRKLSSITCFYDWLIRHENIKFNFPLWTDSESYISYSNDYGNKNYKKIKTKDINKISSTKNLSTYDNSIIDYGRLHPLTKKEQIILIRILKECNNDEMLLSFIIALSTGARMQTVFTLRLKHFEREVTNSETIVKIEIGYGTHCDSKFSKRNILFFPVWLYKKIQIYIKSEKAIRRRNKSKHIFDNYSLQYLFLTSRGSPYYCAKDDKYKIIYPSPPSGENIRMFINNTLKPKYAEQNLQFNFSFHDLRATYGINLVDSYTPLLKEKKISLTQILNIVRERMGHSSLRTTELYLNYKVKGKNIDEAQNNYEQFLRRLLDE
ncbi:site-specific integrase [Aliarcobacter butzleri]|uniref:tyrosine-type recombinase/integrase n=1 Tax=Aliarcobacter butzleri TaxID=28197 RepID=UPI001EDD7E87|nr:site-specific integrase [Aliarcobacter butzleri]MCG3703813.1 site-specific integrase [Aliarcobacter butzleri]